MATRLDLTRYIEAANAELVSLQAESAACIGARYANGFRVNAIQHGINNAIARIERMDADEDFNRHIDQMAQESYWQDLYERGLV